MQICPQGPCGGYHSPQMPPLYLIRDASQPGRGSLSVSGEAGLVCVRDGVMCTASQSVSCKCVRNFCATLEKHQLLEGIGYLEMNRCFPSMFPEREKRKQEQLVISKTEMHCRQLAVRSLKSSPGRVLTPLKMGWNYGFVTVIILEPKIGGRWRNASHTK